MIGVVITQSGGARSIVLFNNQAGQVPAPITSTSYTFPGSGLVSHTLVGLVPNAPYSVTLTGGVVSVNQSAGGERTASPSGVLRFTLSSLGPPAATPTGINATAITGTRVDVSWTAVTGATSYEIDRRDAGGGFEEIGESSGNSFSDFTATAGESYLYRVRAANGSGTSGDSTFDIATTVIFADDPLTAGTLVRAIHLSQLRTAVNAVQSLANLQTITNPSPVGTTIKATDVTDLRTALDAALTALGLTAGGYTNSPLTGAPIKPVDFQELRNRVK